MLKRTPYFRILVLFLSFALATASCQGDRSQSEETSTPQPSPLAYASETPAQTSPTQAALSGEETQAAPPGCTAVSPQPTPGATEQAIFPAVTESDWVKGPEDATVTITEYSDFM